MVNLRGYLNFSTRELALISILSSLWVTSQIYLGPVISQVTQVHGVVQRVLGWFLMLILAELTEKFGRVTAMTTIASLATRVMRLGRLYALFVGAGYALGGFTFDLLFFVLKKNPNGKYGRIRLLFISGLSGAVALIPYLLFKFTVLGFYGFILWLPYYLYLMAKNILLSMLGAILGASILSRVKSLFPKVRE